MQNQKDFQTNKYPEIQNIEDSKFVEKDFSWEKPFCWVKTYDKVLTRPFLSKNPWKILKTTTNKYGSIPGVLVLYLKKDKTYI